MKNNKQIDVNKIRLTMQREEREMYKYGKYFRTEVDDQGTAPMMLCIILFITFAYRMRGNVII